MGRFAACVVPGTTAAARGRLPGISLYTLSWHLAARAARGRCRTGRTPARCVWVDRAAFTQQERAYRLGGAQQEIGREIHGTLPGAHPASAITPTIRTTGIGGRIRHLHQAPDRSACSSQSLHSALFNNSDLASTGGRSCAGFSSRRTKSVDKWHAAAGLRPSGGSALLPYSETQPCPSQAASTGGAAQAAGGSALRWHTIVWGWAACCTVRAAN